MAGDPQQPHRYYSVELPLSAESKTRLREKLCEVEGPWQSEADFRPHLSFAVIRELVPDVDQLRDIVSTLAQEQAAFHIQVSAMGVFPGRRPVFTLTPAWHSRLLEVHHWLSDRFSEAGITPIPYYQRDHWSPHITITMGRPRREVAAAMEGLSRVWWPGEYCLDQVELVEFHPARKLLQLPLVGNDD